MSEHMKALRLYQQELAQIGIEHESPRLMNLAAAIHHEIKALAGEPAEPVLFVGWAALAPNGNVRLWSRDKARVDALAEAHGLEVVRLVRSPLLGHPPNAIEALKTAIDHIEHMAAWIAQQGGGYSFESLGEDMGDMRAPLAAVAEESSAEPPETSLGGLRQWCEDRLEECATRAQDPKLAASLQLGWAMSAETFNSVIEKIDDMDPINASDGAAPAEARSASPAWPYSFYDGRSRTERLEALAKLFEQPVDGVLTGRVSIAAPTHAAGDIRALCAFAMRVARVEHSQDEGFCWPEPDDPDDARAAVDMLVAEARDLIAALPTPPKAEGEQ